MRGHVDPQASMFTYFSPESRVPAEHPLRSIKAEADAVLGSMSADFDRLYADTGRPSIPPERLLKASLLIALYSVRSDRVFCEMLDYNILFRWFLDMNLEQPGLDQSNFSRLRERLIEQDTARRFFDAVVRAARKANLLSDEHFTVDGTLIEAWASLKSFQPKDGPPSAGDGTGGMVDFRGQRRTNDTHESITDDESKLMRKGKGKEAKLSYGGHALMENRSGLCVDRRVSLRAKPRRPRRCLAVRREGTFGPPPSGPTRAITARTSWRTCESATSLRPSRESKAAEPPGSMHAPRATLVTPSASERESASRRSSAG
jgi:transposase